PKPIELVRIYVEEEVVGQGLGSALMKACLEEIKTNGLGTIWLAVWQKNQRAIDFYKRWGFEKVGVKEFVVGSDVQDDFIMERSVELN
ncbi:MAG: GNAT family N-acetyltransferase, partial [Anaerolineales bacterium]